MENIILNNISINKNRVDYHFSVSAKISKYFTTDKLSIVYDFDISNIPLSVLTIPFVANLIPIAWLTNATLWVEQLDLTFYNSVKNLKVAYQEMNYNVPFKGRLVSAKLIVNEIPQNDKSLLLFSGGVDAQTSFFRNKSNVKMLCNIQGWYRDYNIINEAAETEQEFVKKTAESNGINSALVKSNFATVINTAKFADFAKKLNDSWWHAFNHSMAFISISIPIAFINGYNKIIIASSFTYCDNVSAASFATTDSEFCFAKNGVTIHDAFELSRHDKIKYMVEVQKKTKASMPIRVCSFNKDNCCACEKCFRTISAIVSEGGDIRNFDFNIEGSTKVHFEDVFKTRLALWGVKIEHNLYLSKTKQIMRQNLSIIEDKEFAEWYINFDFLAEKKKALRHYYITNFWSIIKRKVRTKLFHEGTN